MVVGREVCLARGSIGAHEEIADERIGEGFEFAGDDAGEICGCCPREDEGAICVFCCGHLQSFPDFLPTVNSTLDTEEISDRFKTFVV